MGARTPPVTQETITYVDTSALARAYLMDEPEHEALRRRILEGPDARVTCALTLVEMTSAIRAAARAGRVVNPDGVVARVALDMALGRVNLIAFSSDAVMDQAQALCERHPLRTMDAVHLAVALHDAREIVPDADLVFLTRDSVQADAARREGLRVE